MSDEPEETQKTRSWFSKLNDFIHPEPKDKAELTDILRDCAERHLLSGEMLSMIERVLQVSEMQVRDIMIPRSQMVAIEKGSQLLEIIPIITDSGHSRFPVIDSEKNEVLGILLAKDILKIRFREGKEAFDISKSMRPTFLVPESKRLDILLREFRVKRNHMAIVIDEYAHVAGLVTIEDVLEQIVGEIEDEYDIDESDHIKKHNDNLFTVKASTSIEDFNEYFATNFSDDELDTIGGLVLQQLGHLPTRGEMIKIQGLHFKVLHSDQRRIYLLEITKKA